MNAEKTDVNVHAKKVFMTCDWNWLVMLNFEIDEEVLRPLVPAGTELDTWHGTPLVSIVGFLFSNSRFFGIRVPFHQKFEEVNLRFYVKRVVNGELRRGVVFIREIAPKWAVSQLAGICYHEHYMTLPMRHHIALEDGAPRENWPLEYQWRFKGEWNSATVTPTGPLHRPAPNSIEEFVIDHYWGYTARNARFCHEFCVEHAPWKIWNVFNARLNCDPARLYGPQFARALSVAPVAAMLVDGSPIRVLHGAKVHAARARITQFAETELVGGAAARM